MHGHLREPREPPWMQEEFENPWHDPGDGRKGYRRQEGYQNREYNGYNQASQQWQQGRQGMQPRPMKLDFLRFKRGDPTSWIFKVIKYF